MALQGPSFYDENCSQHDGGGTEYKQFSDAYCITGINGRGREQNFRNAVNARANDLKALTSEP